MDAATDIISPHGRDRRIDGAKAMGGRLCSAQSKIFKKSLIGADLQPRGRDVAQQRFQITGIPLPTTYFTTGEALWGAATYCGGVYENQYYAAI